MADSIPQTQDVTNAEYSNPTQRLPFPCSNHKHISECIEQKHACDSNGEPTLSNSCTQPRDAFQINITYRNTNVAWKDHNSQKQSVDKIYFEININTTPTANTALFKLYCKIYLRVQGQTNGGNNLQPIYLFIYPGDIHDIQLETHNGRPSLHFFMEQYPKLVIPKGDALEPKQRSKTQLDSIQALATTKDFIISLDGSIAELTQKHLQQIAFIFSANNTDRPSTDDNHADVMGLYCGKSGMIANITTVANTCNKVGLPPPYYESAPSHVTNKRKRERGHEGRSLDTDNERSPIIQKARKLERGYEGRSLNTDIERSPEIHKTLSMEDVCTFLEGMESRLGVLIKSHASDMEERVKRLENRFDGVIKELEDVISGADRSSRYGTAEIEEKVGYYVNQTMDDLKTESRDAINTAVNETFKDIKDEVDETFEQLGQRADEVEKTFEQLEQRADKRNLLNLEAQLRRCLSELPNMRFQLSGNLSFDS